MKKIIIAALLLCRLDAQTLYTLHLATGTDPIVLAASALPLNSSQQSQLFLIRYTSALYGLYAIVDQNKTRVREWLPSYLPLYLSTIVEPIDTTTLETRFYDITPFLKKALRRRNLKQVGQTIHVPFDFASDRLNSKAWQTLQPIRKRMEQLRERGHATLYVTASADSIHMSKEKNDSNMALSLRRARAVCDFLSQPDEGTK